MPVYVVTYDLNKELKRPPIVAEIKKTPSWAKLSESSYAIDTVESVAQVHTRFGKHLDSNDTFYVVSLSRPWTGAGPVDVNKWLATRLGAAG